MIRIETAGKKLVIHDGLDVSITDDLITVRTIPFLSGMSNLQGQAVGQSLSPQSLAQAQGYGMQASQNR